MFKKKLSTDYKKCHKIFGELKKCYYLCIMKHCPPIADRWAFLFKNTQKSSLLYAKNTSGALLQIIAEKCKNAVCQLSVVSNEKMKMPYLGSFSRHIIS